MEDRICGYGPTLTFYLEKDEKLAELNKNIFNVLVKNYEAAKIYAERFQYIWKFYDENLNFDENLIKNEIGKKNIFNNYIVFYRSSFKKSSFFWIRFTIMLNLKHYLSTRSI